MARVQTKRHSAETSGDEGDRVHRLKRVKLERRDDPGPSSPGLEVEGTDEVISSESESEGEDITEEQIIQDNAFPDDEANNRAFHNANARKRKVYGTAAEAGVMKSVTLVNFMCHKHITVGFGPKMNFLVGHNGSGKSAILTAIAVALGGKTSHTGRGTGLKDLIKKGEDKAIITLSIANGGPDAYKKDLYTNDFIIERTLSASGSSAYKFRTTREGRVIATKRAELQSLLDHHSLNVESPLTILTQDAARSFLQNATPQNLYKFFLEGTGLESLTAVYHQLQETHDIIRNLVRQGERALPDQKEKVRRLWQKVQDSERVIEMQAKYQRLHHEAAWAFTIEKEGERDEARKKLDEKEDTVADANRQLQEETAALAELREKVSDLERQVQEFDSTRRPDEAALARVKKKIQEQNSVIRAIKDEITEARDTIKDKEVEIAEVDKTIKEKQRLREADEDPEQALIKAEIQRFENMRNNIMRELPQKQTETEQKQAALDAADQKVEGCKQNQLSCQRQVNIARERLQSLRQQAGNRLSAYGQGLERVLADIDAATWQGAKPIGPLGQYVELLDPSYRKVLSANLGSLMCTFAVTTAGDNAQLLQLLQRNIAKGLYKPFAQARNPWPIIQHTGDRFDFSQGDLHRLGKTMLSVLRVSDEDVLRILIVQRGIERNFLAPSIQQADLMITDLLKRGIQRPSFYTADMFSTSGTSRGRESGPIQPWKANPLFSRDVAADIREQEENLDKLEREAKVASDASAAATAERNRLKMELAEANRAVTKARMAIPKFNGKIKELEERVEDSPDDTIAQQEELKKSAQSTLDYCRDQIILMETNLSEKKTQMEHFESEKEVLDTRLFNFTDEKRKQREALAVVGSNVRKKEERIGYWDRIKTREQAAKADAQIALDRKEREVKTYLEEAIEMCNSETRIPTKRKPQVVIAEHKEVEASIDRAEKRGTANKATVTPIWQKAKKDLERTEKSLKQLDKFTDTLTKAITERRRWWAVQRSHTALTARMNFLVHSQKRGFDSRLDFNHGMQHLIVRVCTNASADGARQQGQLRFKLPQHLSGGEKSFTTVALLLALWEAAQSPVRCLDEWDVFLDHVNRGIAAEMLIEGAKMSEKKQFILITPQNMGAANKHLDPSVDKQIRLSDPERNQGILEFAPAPAGA